MAVTYDTFTDGGLFTTTTPHAFDHTPSGTPKGVAVFVVQDNSNADLVSAVTYGGVSMTKIVAANDTAGEPGHSEVWFLGSSIPTGVQSVSITHTGDSNEKYAVSVTVTADTDTAVGSYFDALEENAFHPYVEMDSGSDVALRLGAIFSGRGSYALCPDAAGQTNIANKEFTNPTNAVVSRDNSAVSGTARLTWDALSDDTAAVGIAIYEYEEAAVVNRTNVIFVAAS